MREIRLSGSTRGEWVCGFFPVRPLSYSTGSVRFVESRGCRVEPDVVGWAGRLALASLAD